MSSIRFASILFKAGDNPLETIPLCYHADHPIVEEKCGTWNCPSADTIDFTTYFNALSVAKLKRYTTASHIELHLSLSGAGGKVYQTFARALDHEWHPVSDSAITFPASKDVQEVTLSFKDIDDAAISGFVVETDGPVTFTDGYYELAVDDLREVNLVLSMTTFKKESYVTHNVEKIRSEILSGDDEISRHFDVFVVDNGRTLPESIASEHIHLFPNQNVGGSGGFARGMYEALRLDGGRPTHILLMDDDVSVSAESFRRVFNLLRILRPEYHRSIIAGAMLSILEPDFQHEDIGFMSPDGVCVAAKPGLRMSKLESLVYSETFDPANFNWMNRNTLYSAWWFSCIPMDLVREKGLPMPFFVRCDDAEFGIRCKVPIISMNGLCVWHEPFEIRYNAGVERYQSYRNSLIAQFSTEFAPNSDFIGQLKKIFVLELKKFNYKDAQLVLESFEDFLAGPGFIAERGKSESRFMDANRNKERLKPLDQVEAEAHELGLTDFHANDFSRSLIDISDPRPMKHRLVDFATDNFQRFASKRGRGYAVISSLGWVYPAEKIRGCEYIIVIDWYSQKGAIRHKDAGLYQELVRRFHSDMRYYRSHEDILRKEYHEAFPLLTSTQFWERYLGLEASPAEETN